jgi:hypothetical protein
MRRSPSKVALSVISLLLGCQSLPPTSEMNQPNIIPHYVVIDRDGFARGPNHEKFSTADLENHLRATVFKELTARAEALSNCEPKPACASIKVLLFVHGGMNGYDDDFVRMRRLIDRDSPSNLPGILSRTETHYFPIFLNWNSEPFDSTIDDLFGIRFGKRTSLAMTLTTAPFVVLGRIVKSIASIPVSLVHISYNVAEAYGGTREAGDSGCAIFDAVVYAPLLPFYLLTTPVLEGFGTPAWDIMNRRAELAVATRLPEDSIHAQEGAARTFVRLLMEQGQVLPVKLEVTLVGHSMGTIIINQLMPLIEAQANSYVRHIVYIAPAAKLENVNDHVIPYLQKHPNAHFFTFVLNRRDEAREVAKDGLIWFLPRGSLLAWIDTFFEPAYTIHEETAGRIANLNQFFDCDWDDRIPSDRCTHVRIAAMATKSDVRFGYRERLMHDTSPFPKGQNHIYETVRPMNSQIVAREHGDFTESRYLGQVLCRVDENAFKHSLCTTSLNNYPPVENKRLRFCEIPFGFRH